MTTPAQPATGAGAPETGDPSTEPTAQPTVETVEQPATGDGTDWKARAREWENRSKANNKQLGQYEQQMSAMRKALGIDAEEDLPEHAQQKISEYEQRTEAAEAKAVELAYRDTVRTVAGANLDAEALLDSGSFRDAVTEELGDDFTDAELAKAVTKVAKSKEFTGSPRFAKHTGAARSGGEFPGGPSSPASIDQQIADAEKAGNHLQVIALKRHRAAMTQ